MTSEIDLEDTYEYQVCRNNYTINDILVGTFFAGPMGSSSPPDQFLHESDLPGVALFFLINPYIVLLGTQIGRNAKFLLTLQFKNVHLIPELDAFMSY